MTKFHNLGFEEVAKQLKTDLNRGLTADEAARRLEEFGPNQLDDKDKTTSKLSILLRQFYSPLMLILLGAMVFSVSIKEISDAIVIGLAIVFNVLVGFLQEWKAERVSQSLVEKTENESMVIRDGKIEKIKSHELVPGDIVMIRAGDQIPADIRLSSSNFLKIKESMLTGESCSVSKQTDPIDENAVLGDRTNMAFSGTFSTAGGGQGIVVATAGNTQAGQIQEMLANPEGKKTPLQEQIIRLSWIITLSLCLTICVVCLAGILRGIPWIKMFTLAIAVAVAAVPEGLMIAMTVILSIGMSRMLARKALVRDLLSAETLGSVSVVCTDKTGTLTEGNMHLRQIVTTTDTFDPDHPRELDEQAAEMLFFAYKSSDAKVVGPGKFEGDEAEVAILRTYKRAKAFFGNLANKFKKIGSIPFDPAKRFSACLCRSNDGNTLFVKGSHEEVFQNMCNESDLTKRLSEQAEQLTLDGLRVFALAKKTSPNSDIDQPMENLEPMGLLCFSDPLRQTARDTVKTMQNAGIKVVMITGDHRQTALNIAHQAGLETSENGILQGQDIQDMDLKTLSEKVKDVTVFSRVSPHDKIKIVKAFRASGQVTAMTGDGANDAPALKAADIGLAIGSGSQIAKSVSGIVLLDSNLSTIGKAIEEGRIIFDNIRKVIVYFLADGFAQTALVLGSLACKLPIPLLPAQILWINFITDGFPSMALTADPGDCDIMNRPPRAKNEPIVNTPMKILIFINGIITDIVLFAFYFMLIKSEMPLETIRTITFQAMAMGTLAYVFSVRSLKNPIWKTNPFSNLWLVGAMAVSIGLQLACWKLEFLRKILKLAPMDGKFWLIIIPLSMIKLGSIEFTKSLFRMFGSKKENETPMS